MIEEAPKEEEGKLFWFRQPKTGKDLLVFWSGHPSGNLYVYEYKDTLLATGLDALMAEHNRECWIWELGHRDVVFSARDWESLQKST